MYTEEDLNTLVKYIKNMTTLYDLREDDWTEENYETIREYLLNPSYPLLTIYFDADNLCCMLEIPDKPFLDMTYFLRETPGEIFEVETFHDNIMFGTMHEAIEGSLLKVIENVYAPYFMQIESWPDSKRVKSLAAKIKFSFIRHKSGFLHKAAHVPGETNRFALSLVGSDCHICPPRSDEAFR